ncbi:MAG: T9SS type A sorting domain-containing protein [Lentimicrobium sp.]|nr:T9SS type A sorting domain-containing protein [Lentimicrobium sp.]
MPRILFVYLLSLCFLPVFAQHLSIHQEESAKYAALGLISDWQYDSLNNYVVVKSFARPSQSLQKRVFGYHPYWSGSVWQNYRWDLLSDLSYFSYEVNPETGEAITIHDWANAAVLDTAISRGVKVHLCVTLFSGHATFFGNPQAQQTLTSNLISLIASRGAHGINLDFEAVPASQQQGLTNYIIQLSEALHSALPGAELSIAAPAVNWSNTFDLRAITPWLDFIMIMAYDYYWNGSSLAGPVSGLWPLVSSFDYGVNRSLSYYQGMGVPANKLLLGLPYYGREWPVSSNSLPAATTGSGFAVTYRNIRANATFYNPSNLYWDYRSYNPYYSYFTSQWRQCFFDDERSLGAKYDLVNRRQVAGIGIWALGYDNGYSELWNLIEEKFTGGPLDFCNDTIYDSGGPWWNYANNETYTETIFSAWPGQLSLSFNSLSLEPGFDSLWIYDGNNTDAPLLVAVSGNELPIPVLTTDNVFTIKFFSDNLTTRAGYELVWSCTTSGVNAKEGVLNFKINPNPVNKILNIELPDSLAGKVHVLIFDLKGKVVLAKIQENTSSIHIPVSNLSSGLYILQIEVDSKANRKKIAVL